MGGRTGLLPGQLRYEGKQPFRIPADGGAVPEGIPESIAQRIVITDAGGRTVKRSIRAGHSVLSLK